MEVLCRCSAVLLVLATSSNTQCTTSAFTSPGISRSVRPTTLHHSALGASSNENENDNASGGNKALFFADDSSAADDKNQQSTPQKTQQSQQQKSQQQVQLFSESTIAEATDALSSVGWAQPLQGEGEMTSEDPFVRQIDLSIQKEMGVSLDELLNPAKVVNLERDLYNLRVELAALTGADVDIANLSSPLTTEQCDANPNRGGEEVDAIRAKISKKEKDLEMERRAVFRGWLKNVFLGQALLSMALSYVMATNPGAIFGGFDWYNNVANMDTSIQVLGFWWWWLFIVPSLRSRRPVGLEKKALDIAFLGSPLISLLSPVATKDTGVIWWLNFVVVAGAYGYAFLIVGDENDEGGDGEDGKGAATPGWLKFIYKSLDFGAGRERGARR